MPVSDLLGGAVRATVPFSGYLFYKWAGHPGSRGRRVGRGAHPRPARRPGAPDGRRLGLRLAQAQGRRAAARRGVRGDRGAARRPSPTAAAARPQRRLDRRDVAQGRRPAGRASSSTSRTRPRASRAWPRSPRGTDVPLATNMCVIAMEHLPPAIARDAVQVVLSDHHLWGGLRRSALLGGITDVWGMGLSMHSNSHLGVSLAAMVAPRRRDAEPDLRLRHPLPVEDPGRDRARRAVVRSTARSPCRRVPGSASSSTATARRAARAVPLLRRTPARGHRLHALHPAGLQAQHRPLVGGDAVLGQRGSHGVRARRPRRSGGRCGGGCCRGGPAWRRGRSRRRRRGRRRRRCRARAGPARRGWRRSWSTSPEPGARQHDHHRPERVEQVEVEAVVPWRAAIARWKAKSASTAPSCPARVKDCDMRRLDRRRGRRRRCGRRPARPPRSRRRSGSRASPARRAWVRMADDSSVNDDGSGTASTNEPRPWKVSTRPSACSRVTASRTTVRETAYSSISSASDGSFGAGARSPARILSLRPATTRWASGVVHGVASCLEKVAVSTVERRIRLASA